MGMCSSEPNVTVEVLDSEPIVYQHMDANRMRQVFRRHVLQGEVQTDFALGKIADMRRRPHPRGRLGARSGWMPTAGRCRSSTSGGCRTNW